ncbi:hypothetical protein F5146DRAFT_1006383 [Armillaria mellea]|nr:hypothetical protein F5146DRAFT_1006383 [Armillaria mellea]
MMADAVSKKAHAVLQSGKPYYWGALFACHGPQARFVPVPLIESAAEYRTCDDIYVDYWLSCPGTLGGVMDTNVGMKIMGNTFMLDCVVEEGCIKFGNLFAGDFIEATKELTRVAHFIFSEKVYIKDVKVLRKLVLLWTTTTKLLTALFNHSITVLNKRLHGSFTKTMFTSVKQMLQPVSIMTVQRTLCIEEYFSANYTSSSGEILFDAQVNALKGLFLQDQNKVESGISSRSWIFDSGNRKQYLMLYADPHVVQVDAPGYRFVESTDRMSSSVRMATTEEMLSESADFPVRMVMSLKKHLLEENRCELSHDDNEYCGKFILRSNYNEGYWVIPRALYATRTVGAPAVFIQSYTLFKETFLLMGHNVMGLFCGDYAAWACIPCIRCNVLGGMKSVWQQHGGEHVIFCVVGGVQALKVMGLEEFKPG